jgi:phosphatidylglycerol:prolipoprotein diacylglycerol transferase
MVVCGLIGARVFFVVQKFELFQQATFGLTLAAMLDMTQGGLVVYGSLIGAMIGGGLYALRARMPLLETADVVAPGMLLGLAIGRIGCFFNGCCFGGPCDIQWLQVRFPAGAPPYVTQLESGELLGLTTTAVKLPVPTSSASPGIDWMTGYRVDAVAPGSIAHRYGVQPGEQILISFDDDLVMRAVHGRRLPIESTVLIQSDRGPTRAIPLRELPARSLSVHPTQLYSSLNALILTAVTWCLFTFRGRPGTVFGAFLVLKGVTRFLLEIIRADELGVGSTGLTISQWGSLIAIALGLALLGGVWLAKTGRTAVSASASAADTPAPQPKV